MVETSFLNMMCIPMYPFTSHAWDLQSFLLPQLQFKTNVKPLKFESLLYNGTMMYWDVEMFMLLSTLENI